MNLVALGVAMLATVRELSEIFRHEDGFPEFSAP